MSETKVPKCRPASKYQFSKYQPCCIGFDTYYLPILDVNYDVVQILFGHSFGQLNQSLVKVCEVLVGRFHDGNSAVGKQLLHFRFDRIEVARQQVRLYQISSMQSKGENFTEILL